MNIVLLAPFALEPKGTVRARQLPIARVLATAGHRVTLLIPPVDNPADSGAAWQDSGVAVRNLRVGGDTPAARLSVPVRLAVAAWQERPDVVWAAKPFGYAALAAAYLRPFVPLVVQDCDDWEGSGGWATLNGRPAIERRLIDVQENLLPRLAGRITAASRYLAGHFATRLGAARVAYLPNCLSGDERLPDPAAVAALRTRYGLHPDDPVVAFAGYLPPANDLDLAVDALALARREIQNLRLVLIAAGPGLPAFRQAAVERGLGDAIIETGPVPEAELPDYLGLARVALGPYRDTVVNRARCSVKLLHYLAVGRPVVATSVGENVAFVRHGQTGFLTPPDDPAAFAAALVRLAGDPALAEEFGARGRPDVLRRFRWEAHLAPLLAAWRGPARSRRPGYAPGR